MFKAVAAEFIEQAIRDLEGDFSCHVTLHDHWGNLRDCLGMAFFDRRRLHSAPTCRNRRELHQKVCIGHCKEHIFQLSTQNQHPYLCVCPYGVRELIFPIREGTHLLGTLYIGPFRPEAESGAGLAAGESPLAELSPALRVRLERRGQAIVYALLFFYTHQKLSESSGETGGRKEQILLYFRQNSHRRLRVADLGRHLCLSSSRTAHLVRELCNAGFSTMLQQERLRKAEGMLHQFNHSIAEVSASAGFCNEFYFNKLFKAKNGITPGAYRKKLKEKGGGEPDSAILPPGSI